MGFTVTSEQIIWICTFIAAIWAVWKIIKEVRKPNHDLQAKVERHGELLDNDNKRMKKIEESNQMILKSLIAIINHEITGNGIEKMKEAREDLQNFLINN